MLLASGPRPLQAGLCHEAATEESTTVHSDPPSDTQEHQSKPVTPASTYTAQEVTKHKSKKDLWIVIGSDVYDVTEFQRQHPGGVTVMRGVAGKDATRKFDKHHRRGILEPYKPKYRIGVLAAASLPKDNGYQAGGDGGVSKRKGGLLRNLWR
ncbi:Cytochrome b5 [Apiospora aurea]|uniref:Cytochrome b5 n=1 Tax=Apiospora aurea TaxID=335848 RepID=A0ABR1QFK3_9PEZI